MKYYRKSVEELLEAKGFTKTNAEPNSNLYEITKLDGYGIARTFAVLTLDYGCKFFAPDSKKGKLYQASTATIMRYINQSAEYYNIKF